MSAFVFGFGIGLLANYLQVPETVALVIGIGVWLISGVLTIGYSVYYLKSKKDKSAVASVFNPADNQRDAKK